MKAKSEAIYKKVIVKWKDACTYGEGAISLDKAKELTLRRRETIGYMIKKTKECIMIAQTYDHDDQECDDITLIPTQWAIEIIEVK